MGVLIQTPGALGSIAEQASLTNYSSVTAPAAGGVLASLASPPAGVYQVQIIAGLTGTVAAADQDNIELVVDGSVITVLLLPAVVEGATDSPPFVIQVKTAGTSIQLKAVGAGTATAVYRTMLVATRVE